MGKRELLLVVLFVVLGTVLYQATAPPAPEGSGGFSLRDIFRAARGHFGDRSATRTVTREAQLTVPADVDTVALEDFRGRIEVTGTDEAVIDAAVEISLRGIDEADLGQQEAGLSMQLETQGTLATVALGYREGGARPDHTLRLRVPRRLRLKLGGRGVAQVTGLAGAEFDTYRGDLFVEEMTGPVTGTQREGRAEFGPGGTIDLETERGTLRVVRPASLTLHSETTDVEVLDAEGPVTIDQERCTIEVIGGTGPIGVKGEGGTIKLRNVASAVDIDAERLTVSMTMAEAVPVRLAIVADDVDVTLPAAGVELAAEVADGELRVPAALTSTTDGATQRATGTLNGGGPRIGLTVTRGSLTVRQR